MTRLSRHGFTLVETMIALAVTGILVLAVMNFVLENLITSAVTTARAELLSEAESGLDNAARDIRLSANADQNNRWQDNYAPNAPTDPYSWQSNSSTVILATAAEDQSNNILFQDPLKYITQKNNIIYFQKNGTLYKRILAAPITGNKARTTCPIAVASSSCPSDREMLHNVSAFSVRYLDGNDDEVSPTDARSVELTVQLQAKKYGQNITAKYTTRMVFRND